MSPAGSRAAGQLGMKSLTLRDRLDAVRHAAPRHALVAVGALISYLFAYHVLGHPHPYFAPLSTVIVLGVAAGTQLRRAAQLVIGVGLGLLVADLTVRFIGTGPWQLAVIVFIGMSAAVFVGGDGLAVRQAAAAGVLVALVGIPGDPIGVTRFEDALVGAAIAFILVFLISPVDPVRLALATTTTIHSRLARTLDGIADALESGDGDVATDAIVMARGYETAAADENGALMTSRDATRLTLMHRRSRSRVEELIKASELGLRAEQDAVALARASRRPLEVGDPVPREAIDGLRSLAEAAERLPASLGDAERLARVHTHVIDAIRVSSESLNHTRSLSVSLLVGQMRLVANDLLRAAGMAPVDARGLVRTVDG